ncbi:MAG: HAD hydrolase-like protein [Rickettsiales bacterium]|jgi:phosphoglycolate phosphatase-like HAD superfamily hydrolase|nr:HAD hydrolase-like protein [Rickettsiales bacterium]
MIIKNIIWDVDGVLASLDHAYFRFLTEHKKYKDKYKDLKWEDLSVALPIDTKNGSLELSSHPTMGRELNDDFCHNSGDIYFDRPLYPNVAEVLTELNKRGYMQLTMSSGFNAEVKRKMIADTLGSELSFVNIEVIEHQKSTKDAGHGKAMVGEKEQPILDCLEKYKLKASETVLVDDRVFNCETALKIGMHAVRCCPGFATETPSHLKFDAEVGDVLEFKNWLFKNTTQS